MTDENIRAALAPFYLCICLAAAFPRHGLALLLLAVGLPACVIAGIREP